VTGFDPPGAAYVDRILPSAIVLDPADNVAMALRALAEGEEIVVEGTPLRTRTAIPTGQKLARRAIPAGDPVLKYNEPIGLAAKAIAAGEHVHAHNVRSARAPRWPR
jgi:altronate hydrolase